jgi:hypothetical protein
VKYGEFQGREMWGGGGSGKIPFQVKKKRKAIFKVERELRFFSPIHISGFGNLGIGNFELK